MRSGVNTVLDQNALARFPKRRMNPVFTVATIAATAAAQAAAAARASAAAGPGLAVRA